MIYDELAEFFKDNHYVWKFDNGKRTPTADDIQEVVDLAVQKLYDEPSGSILEVGRLIIQKSDNKTYDIYVHFGETK